MIGLQTALFIAGLVVLVVVLIISYDKYRLRKVQGREAELEGIDSDQEEPSLIPRSGFRVEPDPPQITDQHIVTPRPTPPTLKPEFLPETEQVPGEEKEMADQFDVELPEKPALDAVDYATEHEEHAESAPQEVEPAADAAGAALSEERWQEELREVEQVARSSIHRPASMQEQQPAADGLQIEFVARLPGSNVIKRDTALGLYRQYEFDMKKAHRIFGLSHPARIWCDLEKQPESARFTDFGMTIQLADSSGPISESELNQFSQMVLRFADVFGRRFRFSASFDEAMEQAREIDELCRKYDALAILNIITRDAMFRGTEIDRCARELGMEINRRHFYQKRRTGGRGGQHLYSLANLTGNGELDGDPTRFRTNGVTLFMNIPCTRDPAQTFGEMIGDAKQLCKQLDGKLVDQNQRGMTQKGLKHISQEIRQMAAEMEHDGIVPGSELALRLF